jgi:hypothetical protein
MNNKSQGTKEVRKKGKKSSKKTVIFCMNTVLHDTVMRTGAARAA